MSDSERRIVRWLSALSAALVALTTTLLGWPGDLVPQSYLLILGGAAAFLSAFVGLLTGQGSGQAS